MSEGTKPWVVCLTCQSGFPLGLVVDKDGSLERWESPVLDGGEARVLEWLEQHSEGPQHDIRWLPQSEALKALLPIVELTHEDFCADDVRPAVLVPAADVLRSEPEVARDREVQRSWLEADTGPRSGITEVPPEHYKEAVERSIINTRNLLAAWRGK